MQNSNFPWGGILFGIAVGGLLVHNHAQKKADKVAKQMDAERSRAQAREDSLRRESQEQIHEAREDARESQEKLRAFQSQEKPEKPVATCGKGISPNPNEG